MPDDNETLQDIIRGLLDDGFSAQEICDMAESEAEETQEVAPIQAPDYETEFGND